jgi:RND superfamily putative drug exporter
MNALICAAAFVFCVTVAAFATSSIMLVRETAAGMAIAVLIDASLVRALLVPSLMTLLGARNWWLPKPLRWLFGGADSFWGTLG